MIQSTIPEGYVLAAWIMARGNQSDAIWLCRQNKRWVVVHDLLAGYPNRKKAETRVYTPLRLDYKRAEAFRAADSAAQAMIADGGAVVRVDLKSSDREKLNLKVEKSPLGHALRLARKAQRKEKAAALPQSVYVDEGAPATKTFLVPDSDDSRFLYFPEDESAASQEIDTKFGIPCGFGECSPLVVVVKKNVLDNGGDEDDVRKILRGLDEFMEGSLAGDVCRVALRGKLLACVTRTAAK